MAGISVILDKEVNVTKYPYKSWWWYSCLDCIRSRNNSNRINKGLSGLTFDTIYVDEFYEKENTMKKFNFDPKKNFIVVDSEGEVRSFKDDDDLNTEFGSFEDCFEYAEDKISRSTPHSGTWAPYTIFRVEPVLEINTVKTTPVKVKKLANNLTDDQVSVIPSDAWTV